MLTFDIPININVTAETEEEAEDKVTAMMRQEMDKPVLQRAINTWDFIQFVSDDEATGV